MTIEEIKEKLNRDDRFCRYNEMRIDVIRPGYAEAVMEITENKLNGLGIAQGGAIFTLADLAFAGASNAAGFRTVAFTSNISFIRPGTAGGCGQSPRKSAAAAAPASTAYRCSTTTARWSPTAPPPDSSPKKSSEHPRLRRKRRRVFHRLGLRMAEISIIFPSPS